MANKNTSWQGVSGWYDELLSKEDTYQSKVILPNLIRILNPKKGESFLDVACGQGYFSHEVSKLDARVVGIDSSKDLINIATKNKVGNEKFFITNAEQIALNEKFDKAFCVLAIQNIKSIDKVFSGVSKILKPDGTFVIVINHPAFRVPQFSDWGFDEEKKMQYRSVYKYMSEVSGDIEMNPGKKEKSLKTQSFHRPLQYYFKMLAKEGFAVKRLEEWISHKESMVGPKKIAEDNARKEIPLFMMIEAVKL